MLKLQRRSDWVFATTRHHHSLWFRYDIATYCIKMLAPSQLEGSAVFPLGKKRVNTQWERVSLQRLQIKYLILNVFWRGGMKEKENSAAYFLSKEEKQQLQREQKLLQTTKGVCLWWKRRSCSGSKLLLVFITTEQPSAAPMQRTHFPLHHVTSKVSSSLNQTLALSPVIVFSDLIEQFQR